MEYRIFMLFYRVYSQWENGGAITLFLFASVILSSYARVVIPKSIGIIGYWNFTFFHEAGAVLWQLVL